MRQFVEHHGGTQAFENKGLAQRSEPEENHHAKLRSFDGGSSESY
jgi:hypothetical protein